MVLDTLADCVRCGCRRLPVLAPAAAWRPRVVPPPVHADGSVAPRKSSWIPWAERMLRVFGVDTMVCGRCGPRLDVRAIVRVLDTAKKILDGLHRAASTPRTRGSGGKSASRAHVSTADERTNLHV